MKAEITIDRNSRIRIWAARHGVEISWAKLLDVMDHPMKEKPWEYHAAIEVVPGD